SPDREPPVLNTSLHRIIRRSHPTSPPKPGPPRDNPPKPAPPPPPAWRNWLLVAGVLITVALLIVPGMTRSNVEPVPYSQLKQDVQAGKVASVEIGSGRRHNGGRKERRA